MRRIAFIFVLFISLFYSCDPKDGRISFKNNTSDSVIIRFRFLQEIKENRNAHERSGLRVVEPYGELEIGIFNRWEGEFERAKPDTLIYVFVMKKQQIDSIVLSTGKLYNTREFENERYHAWDSLYHKNKYNYKKYSLNELQDKKWKISYTDDGFKRSHLN